MIFTSHGVVLSGSNLFHELNAKCMHLIDQNFTQICMKIQGQTDHLKTLKTSHAPPFWIFFFYGPHPFEIPKKQSLAYDCL
jgi:hypothetical protein